MPTARSTPSPDDPTLHAEPPRAMALAGDGVSDEALLERFARGDADALGLLAERYEAYLFGLALALLGRRGDLARDAVQDTWVKVIRSASRFRGQAAFKTWIYRILLNRCIDLRAQRGPGGAHDGVDASSPGHAPANDHAHDAVATAVAGLPDRPQVVLILCYHRGLTHAQAAAVLDVPLGTLKSRLNAALSALRERLGPGFERKGLA